MSTSISVTAYAGKDSEEFKKHYEAVRFCINSELSFPTETAEFFKGKVGGNDLDEIEHDAIINYIKNGVEVDLQTSSIHCGNEIRIKTADIPKEVDEIIIKLS